MRRSSCWWSLPLFLVWSVSAVSAEWVVREDGRCVEVWSASSLLIGPGAMLDAPLVPLRFVHGGVVAAADCPADRCGTAGKVGLGCAGVLIGAVFGTFAAFSDATLGLATLVSGGLVDWVIPDPTRYTLKPINFVSNTHVGIYFDRPHDRSRDRCGREVEAFGSPRPRRTWYSDDLGDTAPASPASGSADRRKAGDKE